MCVDIGNVDKEVLLGANSAPAEYGRQDQGLRAYGRDLGGGRG